MKNMKKQIALTIVLALVGGVSLARAQDTAAFSQRTAGLDRHDGFLPFYWDAARGRLLVEIQRLGEDLLYFVSVGKGIGSVELGVDRGSTDRSLVIRFERAGPVVHVVQQNLGYRAPGGNRALRQGVDDSFPASILAALPIEAEEGGRWLVDAAPLIIRDAGNLAGLLARRNQGTYRLDPARSAVYLPRTKAFPRNTEIEATVTFSSETPGPILSQVAPDGRALTIRLHHSFVQPPDAGYRPRVADPRIGVSAISFTDYSAPYSDDPAVRWVRRWRLEKTDPSAAVSEPRHPIVFYLDPGIPEPIRTAMREGTLWWNQAFEAAGYRSAIQVNDPPEDMDPMDIRYSYILWVNRDERGFSVGGHFADPRTGEILVAKPRMDSHRIRTISSYWRAYRPTTGDDAENDCARFLLPVESLLATAGVQSGAQGVAEARVVLTRQALLTAHEVGHTLGFGHNWNSSINDRASVMEYPTPRIKMTPRGTVDLSEAFQTSIGAYDAFLARYAYTEFPPDRERAGLDAIVRDMRRRGILFTASTDPRWNRYDDLSSPAAYLRETMAQRAVLLDRYGPEILKAGEPLGELRGMRLWMTYLHHRWGIDAAVRYVGGMYHNLTVKGEDLVPTEIVPAALQREILELLMTAIQPANLAMPERLITALTPHPYDRDPEEFQLSTGYAFDHLSAARTLAAMVIEQLLDPERAARLVAFSDRQPDALTLPELFAALMKHTWEAADDAAPMHQSIRRVIQRVALDATMMLGAHAQGSPEVKAVAFDRLVRLKAQLAARPASDPMTEAHVRQAERDIARYLENPSAFAPRASALPQPPGAPLGVRN